MPEHQLAGLDSEQAEVARTVSGPVAVLAVAGAGKTRTIAQRIAFAIKSGAKPAESALAITYTTKAAAELRRRLANLGVQQVTVGTIHAVALRQLNYFWPKAFGGSAWSIATGREAKLAELVVEWLPDLGPSEAKALISEIEWARSSGLDTDSYAQLAPTLNGFNQTQVIDIWQRYSEQLHSARQLDFDDVLQILIGLLDSNPEFLAEVRRRYTWITVDEFQDVTPLQFALIKLWLGDRQEICVVGDPQQSIYEFAGANPALLETFVESFPQARVMQLHRSYRVPAAVASLARTISGGLELVAESDEGAVFEQQHANTSAEAESISQSISALLAEGEDPREIAILVRVGGQIEKYERALAALNIASTSRNAIRFEHPLVRRSLLILRAWTGGVPASDLVATVTAAVSEAGWSQAATDVAGWEGGSALIALAQDLMRQNPGSTAADFVAEVEGRITVLDPPKPMAVALLTMHSAKGLEWSHVFLPELNTSLLPYPLAPVRSERNLLYVAVTRTRRNLYLSHSLQDERGRTVARTPLLTGVQGEQLKVRLIAQPDAPAVAFNTTGASATCRLCGKGLSSSAEIMVQRCRTCPADFDPNLLAALQKWRKRKAFETGEVEWLLLTDGSLQALVELRPSNLDTLANVHGLLPHKVEKFGEELLELLRRF